MVRDCTRQKQTFQNKRRPFRLVFLQRSSCRAVVRVQTQEGHVQVVSHASKGKARVLARNVDGG